MPPIGPISRRNLIRYLRRFGFNGPHPGGSHEYMRRNRLKVTIPNPHRGDIRIRTLVQILRQAGISRAEWERL